MSGVCSVGIYEDETSIMYLRYILPVISGRLINFLPRVFGDCLTPLNVVSGLE